MGTRYLYIWLPLCKRQYAVTIGCGQGQRPQGQGHNPKAEAEAEAKVKADILWPQAKAKA